VRAGASGSKSLKVGALWIRQLEGQAALDDDRDMLQDRDVLQWVALHGDQVA